MKTLFTLSLVSALLSLLALLAWSAMTIVPRPGAESFRTTTMLAIGGFLVVWVSVALTTRPRQTRNSHRLPIWLGRLLIAANVVYSLVIILFVIG